MTSEPRFSPGDQIVIRSAGDFVRAARPVTVMEDGGDGLAASLIIGTEWFGPLITNRATVVEDAASGKLQRGVMTWKAFNVVLIARPGDAYSPYAFWSPDGELVSWYINLQEPMRRTAFGYDTRDELLDIVVSPDLSSWAWKDENELEQAIEHGFFTRERADRIRRKGEAVIAQIETGDVWWMPWKDRPPDATAPVPPLPEDWNRL